MGNNKKHKAKPTSGTESATVDFGFKQVDIHQKKHLVGEVFSSVAKRYDLMNDLMSFGMHRRWKDVMVSQVPLTQNMHIIDVAGGTGDIAFRMLTRAKDQSVNIAVTVADINADMLREGKSRAIDRGITSNLRWKVADAEALPFPDNHFDVYTIAFGIRNVTDKLQALREAERVLKPGGKFMCMEFSPVEQPLLKKIYDAYSFSIIPRVGEKVTGDRDAYQYLVESIRAFPTAPNFAAMMQKAGFAEVKYQPLAMGAVMIHSGWKI